MQPIPLANRYAFLHIWIDGNKKTLHGSNMPLFFSVHGHKYHWFNRSRLAGSIPAFAFFFFFQINSVEMLPYFPTSWRQFRRKFLRSTTHRQQVARSNVHQYFYSGIQFRQSKWRLIAVVFSVRFAKLRNFCNFWAVEGE